MPYVRNLTTDHVRIGRRDREGILQGVQLEPRGFMVTGRSEGTGDNKKKSEAYYRRSEDFAAVPDEVFNSIHFKRSLGILIEEISEDEYNSLLEAANAEHKEERRDGLFVYDMEGKKVEVEVEPHEESLVTIPMDPKTLEMYAGAGSGTEGRHDPGRGKTLSQLRSEEVERARGVRRVETSEGMSVPPEVLNQMGRGQ